MAKRAVANPLALAVLACLAERPMHPYEISTTLRERGKEQSIKLNFGSLYSVVEALVRHGLITAVETRQEGNRPARTTYDITPAGRAELHEWLAELLSTPAEEYPALESALSLLPVLPPDEAAGLLDLRAEHLLDRLAHSAEMGKVADAMGLPRLFRIEDEFAVARTRTELDFVRSLAAEIRSSTLEGITVWRRLHELMAAGVSAAEISRDPVRHLGEEGHWLGPRGPAST